MHTYIHAINIYIYYHGAEFTRQPYDSRNSRPARVLLLLPLLRRLAISMSAIVYLVSHELSMSMVARTRHQYERHRGR